MTDVIIQNLVTFRLGELPNDCIATAARLRNQPGETFQRRNRLFRDRPDAGKSCGTWSRAT